MISACLTQYPHSFGGKVFRERFPFPGLNVCNAVVLKRSLEVKGMENATDILISASIIQVILIHTTEI